MKKLTLSMMCLLALACGSLLCCTEKENNNSNNNPGGNVPDEPDEEYVDLGLTSGTKWKATNEWNPDDSAAGLFLYADALVLFNSVLPTEAQIQELIDECEWEWNGSGATATGPNGKHIDLPAMGYRNYLGELNNVGVTCNYWTVEGIALSYFSDALEISPMVNHVASGQIALSVRLVQNE